MLNIPLKLYARIIKDDPKITESIQKNGDIKYDLVMAQKLKRKRKKEDTAKVDKIIWEMLVIKGILLI